MCCEVLLSNRKFNKENLYKHSVTWSVGWKGIKKCFFLF